MVCFVLNAIWIPSFWKILVILVVSRPKYVKTARFFGGVDPVWSVCLRCLRGGRGLLYLLACRMSDGLRFDLFVVFTDGIGVQSVGEESYGAEFMARGMTGIIWDDVVGDSWFSVHCKVELTWTSMDSNVQEVNRVIVLLFNCEIEISG